MRVMDVIFQPSRGSPFYIEVGYFDTVLEIKEKIQKDQSIPISKQTLIFNGNILQDELNVHNSEILDRSRIHLLVASDAGSHPTKSDELSPSKIQLLLKMPSSKLGIALEMDVNETIRRLKEKIQEMEGVPINRLAVHANGIELHDHKSMQDCELSDNSEIDVAVRSSPITTTTSRSSSGNMNNGSRKLRIVVVTKCGAEKIPVEVNSSDNVGELRKKLQKLKLDLPQEGYFFIYKQNVMDDDRSFRWHHVCQGDTIEIFSGSVSGGS
ncbi:Ubiquitin domain-containing protein 7SL RNA1 [Sesamum angolense]|uniref:Ubiquitin domain-containing protein 7SL RNA1 n=1 Tax=Sesamum angolense TaxID=2727404 RepID=A0AAE1XI14_9LAMI|nr:Ubiquitin domain-containing protein 7SL RNA1 [Sesamum angolense]